MGTSRVFIVDNIESLQTHLQAVVESTSAAKMKMKEQFFFNQRKLNLFSNTGSITSGKGDEDNVAESSAVSSTRVVNAFRLWSDDAGIPRGEIDVAMAMLSHRPLESFVAADLDGLGNLPISGRTKKAIVAFFSSSPKEGGGFITSQDRFVLADNNADGRAWNGIDDADSSETEELQTWNHAASKTYAFCSPHPE